MAGCRRRRGYGRIGKRRVARGGSVYDGVRVGGAWRNGDPLWTVVAMVSHGGIHGRVGFGSSQLCELIRLCIPC